MAQNPKLQCPRPPSPTPTVQVRRTCNSMTTAPQAKVGTILKNYKKETSLSPPVSPTTVAATTPSGKNATASTSKVSFSTIRRLGCWRTRSRRRLVWRILFTIWCHQMIRALSCTHSWKELPTKLIRVTKITHPEPREVPRP